MTTTIDRYGEPINDDPPTAHDAERCSGWRGEDFDGRPIPCLLCRPHLAHTAKVYDGAGMIR
ncbi:hypothetical protein JGU71_13995 [Antrihabitans sp. YC3-6]|uniref:Uncharacterized protein n=1 Tax=Antrihabitans stalagmiti TaxID=2799499 RepID=A0A934U3R4_9NOCA|nr:hypothetical protein [Antrihabitans stalagmiti]MBJ8340004.1 hypothetical protein [Antrihabitans stalagmiti]